MLNKIAVLPGDGIGPEVIAQAVKVIEAINDKYNHKIELTYADIGAIAIDKSGNPLPQATKDICENSDAVLLGAIGDPKYDNDPSIKVRPEQGLLGLRKLLGLYANVRPIKSYESLLDMSPLKREIIKGVDLVIYRELTGGIYFGKKGSDPTGDNAFDTCEYSKEEIRRIAIPAFEASQKRKKKLTLVDKANVLETSRLWRSVVKDLHKEYPDVEVDYLFIDNAAMQIILNPSRFDVILCGNMFGDIISDEASVIAGSIGLLPSSSFGESHCMFEPVHGSYPQAAGTDKANPIATILSTAMMFDHFNMTKEANDVYAAVNRCIRESILTEDLDPRIFTSCSELGDIIYSLIYDDMLEFNTKKMSTAKSVII
ncbi:UNVERIFIED_CONTAM: hypothetical protein GTU68_054811 [Idotea baltica]|nr:hypothetical protein [Idotea baltica]